MIDENFLWTAVTRRDAKWDGAFVYAVSSTGIYCRPTCPSRRPSRERVRFFAEPSAASAAGFRACRRCHPDAARADTPGLTRVIRACRLIASRHGERVPVTSLAKATGVGGHQLVRSFKQTLGVTPAEYAEACRTGCLKAALREASGVAEATYAAGFGSGSRVYERAASTLGMTPARYARGGQGERVTYAIATSSVGLVLAARTSRGICAVSIGATAEALTEGLQNELPYAALTRDDSALAEAIGAIVAAIDGRAPDPRLPLDIRATAFQQRVWRELQNIPRGVTRSYRDIATAIGAPAAARAVARACASNPVAIVVPCHRVVHGDGASGGYRWGPERKRKMLEREYEGAPR